MISRRNFVRKSGLAALGGVGAAVLGRVFPELKPAAAHQSGRLQPYDPYRAAETGVSLDLDPNVTVPFTNVTTSFDIESNITLPDLPNLSWLNESPR